MKPETLQALKESIQHWENLVETPVESAQIGGDYCALCKRFLDYHLGDFCVKYYSIEDAGEKCPVFEKSGEAMCRNTPYTDIRSARVGKYQAAFHAAALRELDFLKSLLPQEPIGVGGEFGNAEPDPHAFAVKASELDQ